MASEKVFSITGKEVPKEKEGERNDKEMAEATDSSNAKYINGLHVFTILFGCGLAMSILALIPRHNSIEESQYWFEIIFVLGFGSIIVTPAVILDLHILMGKDSIVTIWVYLKVVLVHILTLSILFCFCYTLWTIVLGYNPPMPFVANVCLIPGGIVQFITVPMLGISRLLEKKEFKRKRNHYFMFQLLWILVLMVKGLLSLIFEQLQNSDAQCIIAVLLPIVKRCTNSVFSKQMKKMIETENDIGNVLVSVSINYSYGLWAAISLVGARSTTMVCMVAVEFFMQLNMTYRIIKLHKKVTILKDMQAMMEKKKEILKLLLAELSEGLVPLAYAIGFAMTYYGPNGNLYGNDKRYWQYREVEDASWTFRVMFGLFALDLICLLLNSTILWIYSNTNLFKEFCILMKKYWYVMAFKLVNNFLIYFNTLDVNGASDTTFNFAWITSNKTFNAFSDENINVE